MLGRLEIINVIQRMLKQWDYNGISRLLDSLLRQTNTWLT